MQVPMISGLGVRPQETPGARLQAPDIQPKGALKDMALVSKGLQDVGEVTSWIGDKQEAIADDAAVRDATARFMEEGRATLSGENGLYTRRSKAARGITQEGKQKLEAIRNKYAKEMQGDRQKIAFGRLSQSQIQGDLQGLSNHEMQEVQKWQVQSRDAESYQAIQKAATLTNDPDGLVYHANIVKANTAVTFADSGPEEVTRQTTMRMSAFHSAVIGSMRAGGQSEKALAYFEANRGEMTADDQNHNQMALTAETLHDRGQASAIAYESSHPKFSDRVRAAMEIKDYDLRTETIRQIEDRERTKELAEAVDKRERDKVAWKRAYQMRDAGTWNMKEFVDDDPDTRGRIEAFHAAEVTAKMRGWSGRPNDPAVYYELRKTLHNNPEKFAGLNLLDYAAQLSDAKLNELMELQTAPDKRDWAKAESSIVDRTLDQYGITNKDERAAALNQYMIDAYATGKPPATPQDAESVARNVIVQGYLSRDNFFTDDEDEVRRFEAIGRGKANWKPYAPDTKQWIFRNLENPDHPSVIPGSKSAAPSVREQEKGVAATAPDFIHPSIPKNAKYNPKTGHMEVPHITGGTTRWDPKTGLEIKR